MEQSKGHSGANVVTVIMKSKGVDLQTAVDFLGGYCEALTAQLLEAKSVLQARSDPAYFRDAVRLMDAFGDWVRGNVAYVLISCDRDDANELTSTQVELWNGEIFRKGKQESEGDEDGWDQGTVRWRTGFERVISSGKMN